MLAISPASTYPNSRRRGRDFQNRIVLLCGKDCAAASRRDGRRASVRKPDVEVVSREYPLPSTSASRLDARQIPHVGLTARRLPGSATPAISHIFFFLCTSQTGS